MTLKDSKMEDKLLSLLCKKKFDAVLDLLKDPQNNDFVSENILNILNLICLTVKTEKLLKSDADLTSCDKILMLLVHKGKPKEVLLALLEHADSFKDNEFFCLLLGPLRSILQKIPGKRGLSLQWVLSTLNAHIETLKLPQNLDLQGDLKLLLDTDPAVQEATDVLRSYLSFIEYFVDEVSFESLKGQEIPYAERISHQREMMHRFILKIFYLPLLYHDLHIISDTRPKSTIQTLCEQYIKCLSKICKNVFNLFKYDTVHKKVSDSKNTASLTDDEENDDDDEDESNVPQLALSNLSYLIFVENMALDFQPLVHSNLFIFMENLKYVILLLHSPHNLVLFKGLSLADNLLSKLNESELNYDCIELGAFTEFPQCLINIAITCKFETHRKLAVNIFTSYMSKCNCKGRYHLIMQVLSTANHSGVEGLVINMYKSNLHQALCGNKSYEYFLDKNFNLFMRKVFVLKEGVETDILENSDKIITALNLVRYLLLRDPKEKNLTGVWDLLSFISKNFLDPLTTGLDFSRAHYKQALIDVENGIKKTGLVDSSISVDQENLPDIPSHLQKDVYNKALVTFDVIESILCRVKELTS